MKPLKDLTWYECILGLILAAMITHYVESTLLGIAMLIALLCSTWTVAVRRENAWRKSVQSNPTVK